MKTIIETILRNVETKWEKHLNSNGWRLATMKTEELIKNMIDNEDMNEDVFELQHEIVEMKNELLEIRNFLKFYLENCCSK